MDNQEMEEDHIPITITAPASLWKQFWEQMRIGCHESPGDFLAYLLQQERNSSYLRNSRNGETLEVNMDTLNEYEESVVLIDTSTVAGEVIVSMEEENKYGNSFINQNVLETTSCTPGVNSALDGACEPLLPTRAGVTSIVPGDHKGVKESQAVHLSGLESKFKAKIAECDSHSLKKYIHSSDVVVLGVIEPSSACFQDAHSLAREIPEAVAWEVIEEDMQWEHPENFSGITQVKEKANKCEIGTGLPSNVPNSPETSNCDEKISQSGKICLSLPSSQMENETGSHVTTNDSESHLPAISIVGNHNEEQEIVSCGPGKSETKDGQPLLSYNSEFTISVKKENHLPAVTDCLNTEDRRASGTVPSQAATSIQITANQIKKPVDKQGNLEVSRPSTGKESAAIDKNKSEFEKFLLAKQDSLNAPKKVLTAKQTEILECEKGQNLKTADIFDNLNCTGKIENEENSFKKVNRDSDENVCAADTVEERVKNKHIKNECKERQTDSSTNNTTENFNIKLRLRGKWDNEEPENELTISPERCEGKLIQEASDVEDEISSTLECDTNKHQCVTCSRRTRRKDLAKLHKKICPTIFPFIVYDKARDAASFYEPVYTKDKVKVKLFYKPHNEPELVVCSVCKEVLPNKQHQKTLHSRQHRGQEYRCKLCSMQTPVQIAMHCHVADSHMKRPYSCSICNQEFISFNKIFHHIQKTHMGIGDISCQYCDFRTCTKTQMETHRQKYHPNCSDKTPRKEFTCEICGKVYQNPSAFSAHMTRTHSGIKHHCPYDGCSKAFIEKTGLKRHIDSKHKNLRPYLCTECGKQFGGKFTLREHYSSVHGTDRSFVCTSPGCSRSFKRKSHLTVHLRIHNNEKPLCCEYCGFRCRQRNSLNVHLKSKHQQLKANN